MRTEGPTLALSGDRATPPHRFSRLVLFVSAPGPPPNRTGDLPATRRHAASAAAGSETPQDAARPTPSLPALCPAVRDVPRRTGCRQSSSIFTHASTPPALPVKCPGFRCGAVPHEQPVHHVPLVSNRHQNGMRRCIAAPFRCATAHGPGNPHAMTMSSCLAMGSARISAIFTPRPDERSLCPNDVPRRNDCSR